MDVDTRLRQTADDAPDVFGRVVRTLGRLRELVPPPKLAITSAKVLTKLDVHCQMMLSLCPYIVMSTCDHNGFCDASPRGGPCGFVKVLDESHILIPELSGNRRADTLRNLIENPRIGLMVLIPGYEDFLRMNGDAWVVEDPAVLSQAAIHGATPVVGIGVKVREAYMHCAKAARRSLLWDWENWPDKEQLAEMAVILHAHTNGKVGDGSIRAIQDILDESYTKRLFTPSGW